MMIYLVPSLVARTLEQLLPFSYNFGVAYIITRSVVRLDILQPGTAATRLTATQARPLPGSTVQQTSSHQPLQRFPYIHIEENLDMSQKQSISIKTSVM